VKRNRSYPSVGVPELLVGPALPDFYEPEPLEPLNYFAWLQNPEDGDSCNANSVHSNELTLKLGLPVLE
jgi:hypothetical protein